MITDVNLINHTVDATNDMVTATFAVKVRYTKQAADDLKTNNGLDMDEQIALLIKELL